MNHRLPLFAPHTPCSTAAPAPAATPMLIDTLPAKWPVDSISAPATNIMRATGVISSRAIQKFEVKQT